jgi:pimeloyl-ACP methyl ester carboxylesterase
MDLSPSLRIYHCRIFNCTLEDPAPYTLEFVDNQTFAFLGCTSGIEVSFFISRISVFQVFYIMETFNISLHNGSNVTGRYNLPDLHAESEVAANTTAPRRPLIVALHGGAYSSLYFDADPHFTALITSNALGIPFVAIDRPGYEGSTSVRLLPEGSSYPERSGEWLHRYVLPALWTKFGLPSSCSCIVLHCHSLGAPVGIVAAAKCAQEKDTTEYPLAGLICSGWGSRLGDPPGEPNPFDIPELRDAIFMPPGTADASVYRHTKRLMRPTPPEELAGMLVWKSCWRSEWVSHVAVPMMVALGGRDDLVSGSQEHLNEWAAAFVASPRVDGSFLPGAPHNLELSLWSRGWYARSFGFAIECAVAIGMDNGKKVDDK